MLDGALGQEDAITRVINELCGESKKIQTKNNNKTDISQFDSILPPEIPTSWVQCEACRKWRRVAWNVDGETLPDLWECSMNFWDAENSGCDDPQDRYILACLSECQ